MQDEQRAPKAHLSNPGWLFYCHVVRSQEGFLDGGGGMGKWSAVAALEEEPSPHSGAMIFFSAL